MDGWVVRPVTGSAARSTYRCPGCQQAVRPGVSHVVVWPEAALVGEASELRRHWHTACWRRQETSGTAVPL